MSTREGGSRCCPALSSVTRAHLHLSLNSLKSNKINTEVLGQTPSSQCPRVTCGSCLGRYGKNVHCSRKLLARLPWVVLRPSQSLSFSPSREHSSPCRAFPGSTPLPAHCRAASPPGPLAYLPRRVAHHHPGLPTAPPLVCPQRTKARTSAAPFAAALSP